MSSIRLTDDHLFRVDSSLTLIIESETINIEYDLKDGDYNILIFNDQKNSCVLNESGSINNATVHINYLQLDENDLKQNTRIDVLANSSLYVNSTYLGINDKKIVFDLFNKESDSFIDINNNVVCLDDADFHMDVIGTIDRGAKRSKCHQSSHCLTIGEPKNATVKPVLNIDENDVEASHSLSCGTIDEEILFYMNSRGLGKNEALNLILKSYLMPGDNFYEGFIDGEKIREEAIGKVDQLCSM